MPYLGNNLQVCLLYTSDAADEISTGFNGVLKTFALKVGGFTPVPFPINEQQCIIVAVSYTHLTLPTKA